MTKNIPERNSRRRLKPQTKPESPSPELEENNSLNLAEWIRLPAPGKRCLRTGLTRGSYNDLIFADPPKIKSVVVKRPGATRGVRLIHWQSVRCYLHDLMKEQLASGADHKGEVGDE